MTGDTPTDQLTERVTRAEGRLEKHDDELHRLSAQLGGLDAKIDAKFDATNRKLDEKFDVIVISCCGFDVERKIPCSRLRAEHLENPVRPFFPPSVH